MNVLHGMNAIATAPLLERQDGRLCRKRGRRTMARAIDHEQGRAGRSLAEVPAVPALGFAGERLDHRSDHDSGAVSRPRLAAETRHDRRAEPGAGIDGEAIRLAADGAEAAPRAAGGRIAVFKGALDFGNARSLVERQELHARSVGIRELADDDFAGAGVLQQVGRQFRRGQGDPRHRGFIEAEASRNGERKPPNFGDLAEIGDRRNHVTSNEPKSRSSLFRAPCRCETRSTAAWRR